VSLPGRSRSARADADRSAAKARARAAWSSLGDRLATVTPSAIGRAVLTVVVLGVGVGLVAATWPTLLSFAIGGLVAYAVLPVVDALDRVMPRALAAGITMLAAVAALIGAFVIVVPPLTGALLDLSGGIPDRDELQQIIQDALAGLPPDAQGVVFPIATGLVDAIRSGLEATSGDLDSIVPVVLQAALGFVGALFGLLVLPAWLLTVLTDQRQARQAVDRRFAGWLRPDGWAVIRMLDRSAGTYLRGFVLIAIAVGALTYVGLTLSPQLGGPTFAGGLALATLAGLLQLVPELGPVLGLLPAVLLLLVEPERAAVYVASYVAARLIAGQLIGARRVEAQLHVHPAILIPGVVMLGQLGFLWLLLSAPILSFGSDLVRYLHGRLSEPPRPAGLLPGEPLTTAAAAGRASATAGIPPVYRARRAGPPPIDAPALTATATAEPTVTTAAPVTR
jgi:predicted PurR-regulated permease PerM